MRFLDVAQHVDAGFLGHALVADDDVDVVLSCKCRGFERIGRFERLVISKECLQRAQDARFVVD